MLGTRAISLEYMLAEKGAKAVSRGPGIMWTDDGTIRVG